MGHCPSSSAERILTRRACGPCAPTRSMGAREMTPQRTVHSLSATRRERAVEDQSSTDDHFVPVMAREKPNERLARSLCGQCTVTLRVWIPLFQNSYAHPRHRRRRLHRRTLLPPPTERRARRLRRRQLRPVLRPGHQRRGDS